MNVEYVKTDTSCMKRNVFKNVLLDIMKIKRLKNVNHVFHIVTNVMIVKLVTIVVKAILYMNKFAHLVL